MPSAVPIYTCLGRIIRGMQAEYHSLIQPQKELTRGFDLVNVLPFGIQGGAAALMVTGSHETPAEGIMAAGLLLQIIMFRLFAATAVIFKERIDRDPTPESYVGGASWERSMRMLFSVSALMMVRPVSWNLL